MLRNLILSNNWIDTVMYRMYRGYTVTVQRQTAHYAAQLCPNNEGEPLDFAHRQRRFNWQNPLLERAVSE